MIRGNLQYLHPITKLFFTFIVALLSAFVFMLVGVIAAIPFTGIELFTQMINGNLINSSVGFLKYIQLLQGIGLFIVPAFIAAYFFSEKPIQSLSLQKQIHLKSVLIILVISFSAMPLINELGAFNAKLQLPELMSGIEQWMIVSEQRAAELTEKFVAANGIGQLIFNVFLIAVIPAIGEELFFRGVIQTIFSKWMVNKHWPVWLTAFIFSFFHLQFYGFLPRLILGAMFGYMLLWSHNIWLPIIAHFINNFMAVLFYYFVQTDTISVDPEKIGTGTTMGWAVIFSVVAIVSLLLALRVYEYKKRIELTI